MAEGERTTNNQAPTNSQRSKVSNTKIVGNFGMDIIGSERETSPLTINKTSTSNLHGPKLKQNIKLPSSRPMDDRKQQILKMFKQEHLVEKFHSLSRKDQEKMDEDLELLELDLIDLVRIPLIWRF